MRVTKYSSGVQGPTVVILAGVHGNETAGVLAIEEYFPVDLICGTVITVVVNERALEQGVRFIEEDLNRAMSSDSDSHEGLLAKNLRRLLAEADALLDLHTSSSANKPYCICEPHSLEVAKYLPVGTVLTNVDSVHHGSTDEFMNKQRKVAVCVECGAHDDPASVEMAKQSIDCFLSAFGVVQRGQPVSHQVIWKVVNMYRNKKPFLAEDLSDFSCVRRGDKLGMDGQQEVVASVDGCVVFLQESIEPGGECFLECIRVG